MKCIYSYFLSYDVKSGSEITPCNKIDKQLTSGLQISVMLLNAAHNNVAYIKKKS